jgi:hypothetical protein
MLKSVFVPFSVAAARQQGGVHNVHTLAVGLGRTSAGLARTAYVFGTALCFRGLECSSSPTSGTFSDVRGPFGLLTEDK